MTRRFLYLLPLAIFLLLGPASNVALPIEPSDGDIVEGDQNPLFDDPGAFDAAGGVEDELRIGIDEEEEAPDGVRKAGFVGVWQYTGRFHGWFAGKVYAKVKGRAILVARIKGVFKTTLAGDRELAGVILDRKGTFKGVLLGLYGKRGFRARWWIAGEETKGKAKARFIAPYGRAGFVGKVYIDKGVLDEEPAKE